MYWDSHLLERLRGAGVVVVDLRGRLPRNPDNPNWARRPVPAITLIGWHHHGKPLRPEVPYDAEQHYAAIARGQIARNFGTGERPAYPPTICYVLGIAGDGTAYVLNDVEDETWHVGDANHGALAICVDLGEGQEPTPSQLGTAHRVADVLSFRCPEFPAGRADHYGHGEIAGNATACPGTLLPAVQRYRFGGMFDGGPVLRPDPGDPCAELRRDRDWNYQVKMAFEGCLRDLESGRRLKGGTTDRLIGSVPR